MTQPRRMNGYDWAVVVIFAAGVAIGFAMGHWL